MKSQIKEELENKDIESFLNDNLEILKSLSDFKSLKGFELYKKIRDIASKVLTNKDNEADIDKIKETVETLLEFDMIDPAYLYNFSLYIDQLQNGELDINFTKQALDTYMKPDIRSENLTHLYKAIAGIFTLWIREFDNGPANTAMSIIASAFGLSKSQVKGYYSKYSNHKSNKKPDELANNILSFIFFSVISYKNIDWEKERNKASQSVNSKKAYNDVINRYYWMRQLIAFNYAEKLRPVLKKDTAIVNLFFPSPIKEKLINFKDPKELHFIDQDIVKLASLYLITEIIPSSTKENSPLIESILETIKQP